MPQTQSPAINKGDSLPTLTRIITEDMVIAYENLFERIAARSDWKASFHADREAASQTMYQEPIAQGVLTEAFFSVLISRWLPDPKGWIEGGTLTTKFIAPVWYGDTLTYHAEVSEVDSRTVHLNIWAEDQNAKKVIVGQASALLYPFSSTPSP